jgi:hypothetical protein
LSRLILKVILYATGLRGNKVYSEMASRIELEILIIPKIGVRLFFGAA